MAKKKKQRTPAQIAATKRMIAAMKAKRRAPAKPSKPAAKAPAKPARKKPRSAAQKAATARMLQANSKSSNNTTSNRRPAMGRKFL